MTKISVIIPVYNTARYFEQTINSVLNQTYKPHEIIIVNDGSTDNFDEVYHPYQDITKIVNNKTNMGISEAYNLGIRQAQGDWIAICDGDDYWDPNKLALQVEAIENQDADYVFCDKYIYNEVTGKISHYKYISRICLNPLQSLLKAFFASPSTVVIKKTIFDSCGYFNNDFKSSEDYDMWIRIASMDHIKYTHIAQPLVYKRVRTTSIQGSQKAIQLAGYIEQALDSNQLIFQKKLSLTKKKFEEYMGYNLGYLFKLFFLQRKYGACVYCLQKSFARGWKPGLRCIQRILFKRDGYFPWYPGGL